MEEWHVVSQMLWVHVSVLGQVINSVRVLPSTNLPFVPLFLVLLASKPPSSQPVSSYHTATPDSPQTCRISELWIRLLRKQQGGAVTKVKHMTHQGVKIDSHNLEMVVFLSSSLKDSLALFLHPSAYLWVSIQVADLLTTKYSQQITEPNSFLYQCSAHL